MAGTLTVTSVGLVLLQIFTFLATIDAQTASRPRSRSRPSFEDALLSYMCRGTNARICSGNGQCRNGKCSCYTGYSGPVCEIEDLGDIPATSTTTETQPETAAPPRVTMRPCSPADEDICSGHGVCINGVCQCEKGWSGNRCELSMRDGFCKAYQECAECRALMRACPSKCATIAKFHLVFDFPTGTTFHRCRQRSSVRNCVFYYQLEREYPDGQKDIAVKACLPEADEPETLLKSTLAPPETDDGDDNQTGDQERNRGGAGGSGVSRHTSDVLMVLAGIMFLRV